MLCVTGVEDRLQNNVRQTLEMLRNAGVKVWMLTGDKKETAVSAVYCGVKCEVHLTVVYRSVWVTRPGCSPRPPTSSTSATTPTLGTSPPWYCTSL